MRAAAKQRKDEEKRSGQGPGCRAARRRSSGASSASPQTRLLERSLDGQGATTVTLARFVNTPTARLRWTPSHEAKCKLKERIEQEAANQAAVMAAPRAATAPPKAPAQK